jgi:hypothetical protein
MTLLDNAMNQIPIIEENIENIKTLVSCIETIETSVICLCLKIIGSSASSGSHDLLKNFLLKLVKSLVKFGTTQVLSSILLLFKFNISNVLKKKKGNPHRMRSHAHAHWPTHGYTRDCSASNVSYAHHAE